MRNCYIIYTVTSVDIQGIVEIGGRVTHIYEGVFYREIIHRDITSWKKI